MWSALLHFFLTPPSETPNNDAVLVFQMDVIHSTPEEVFKHLQAVGPIFNNLGDNVFITNKQGELLCKWQLTKSLTEQNTVFMNDNMQFIHEGSTSVN